MIFVVAQKSPFSPIPTFLQIGEKEIKLEKEYTRYSRKCRKFILINKQRPTKRSKLCNVMKNIAVDQTKLVSVRFKVDGVILPIYVVHFQK